MLAQHGDDRIHHGGRRQHRLAANLGDLGKLEHEELAARVQQAPDEWHVGRQPDPQAVDEDDGRQRRLWGSYHAIHKEQTQVFGGRVTKEGETSRSRRAVVHEAKEPHRLAHRCCHHLDPDVVGQRVVASFKSIEVDPHRRYGWVVALGQCQVESLLELLHHLRNQPLFCGAHFPGVLAKPYPSQPLRHIALQDLPQWRTQEPCLQPSRRTPSGWPRSALLDSVERSSEDILW
mmetsp:Transcript_34658/g.75358  ORF Transcript_34658/g.75358 Transcript_34658/m.75358 type:complete len:233 (-) Transcript_34658:80-778(-)